MTLFLRTEEERRRVINELVLPVARLAPVVSVRVAPAKRERKKENKCGPAWKFIERIAISKEWWSIRSEL